MTTCKL